MSATNNAPILQVKNLCKDFDTRKLGRFLNRKSTFRAVDDLSFALEKGTTLGIVGESGSGKSTTARLIGKLLEPTSGSVEIEGRDVTAFGRAQTMELRRQVQFVFQDPFSSLNPRHNVEELISAPLRYQGITRPEGNSTYVKQLMERVGLNPDHSARYARQFSGGQAQRIGIARAIAIEPRIVIFDEAVSALDVSIQAQVMDLLRSLQADSGFSFLFISHDLAVVRHLAHSVCVMSQGRAVEVGDRDSIFENPQHEYTKTLLAAVPRIPAEWEEERNGRHGAGSTPETVPDELPGARRDPQTRDTPGGAST